MSTANPTWPLLEPDLVGPIRGADDVRDALTATIDAWSPFYLGVLSKRLAAESRIGGKGQPRNPLPGFGHWRNTPNYRSLGAGMPAAFLVTTQATHKGPEVKGDGNIWATWRAECQVVLFGTTWQQAADVTSWYEKVVLLSVLQHRNLGTVAQTTKWVGSSYRPLEHTSARTLDMAAIGFDVTLANVLNVRGGPKTVPTTPTPGQDETVDEVIVTLDKVPITDPL